MKVLIAGGGTGGHIYPAITIIRTIQQKVPDAKFLYVGTKRGLEADIIPKEGLPFTTVDIQGFERHLTADNILRAGRAMVGVAKATRIVHRFKPDVVIGTGGYVCGPILLAASLAGVPTLIQETDRIMKAQQSRGADFTDGSIMKRLRAFVPVLVPLFLSAFRRADDLAMAMEARCYRGGEGRTQMKALRVTSIDYVAWGFSAVLIAAVLALR